MTRLSFALAGFWVLVVHLFSDRWISGTSKALYINICNISNISQPRALSMKQHPGLLRPSLSHFLSLYFYHCLLADLAQLLCLHSAIVIIAQLSHTR
jgi:hypothetical protein